MAGSFGAYVDREMTVFTGVIHRDNSTRSRNRPARSSRTRVPRVDFARLQGDTAERARPGPANSNEEELGKERLQAKSSPGRLRPPHAGDRRRARIDHAGGRHAASSRAITRANLRDRRRGRRARRLPRSAHAGASRRRSRAVLCSPNRRWQRGRTESRWRLSRRRRARRQYPSGTQST